MEQIARIEHMERQLDIASHAVRRLTEALEECEAAREALRDLEAYYGSEEWKRDFADDEAGLLPKELKRGVLSEDAIWNVLEEWNEVRTRISGHDQQCEHLND